MLSEKLFEKCEDFFDLISADHRTAEVDVIIDHLNEFLVAEVDGHTNQGDFLVAEEVETQIKELWQLLPAEERTTNNNLNDYYDDFMETLLDVLDASTSESNDDDFDDCDLEPDDNESDSEENFE